MAMNEQGIMALNQPPGGAAPATPKLSYNDSYDVAQQAMQTARPDLSLEVNEMLAGVRQKLSTLDIKALKALLDLFMAIMNNPELYEEGIKRFRERAPAFADFLPPTYDKEFLSLMTFVIQDAISTRQAGTQGKTVEGIEAMMPQKFARGGIAEAVRLVASQGRGGDTMLAHINPQEAAILKALGGSGTINPNTGLREYGFFSDLWDNTVGAVLDFAGDVVDAVVDVGKAVVNFVKENPIGRALATMALVYIAGPLAAQYGLSTAATWAAASGTVTAVTGGSLKDIVLSSATAYLGAPGGPVSQMVGKYAPAFIATSPTVSAAVSGVIAGTTSGLIRGQNLGDAVTSGLIDGATSGTFEYFRSGGNTSAAKTAAAEAANNAAVAPVSLELDAPQVQKLSLDNIDNAANQYVKTTNEIMADVAAESAAAAAPIAPRAGDIELTPTYMVDGAPINIGNQDVGFGLTPPATPADALPGTYPYAQAPDIQGRIALADAEPTGLSQNDLWKKEVIARTGQEFPAGDLTLPIADSKAVAMGVNAPAAGPAAAVKGVPEGGVGSLEKVPTVPESLKKIASGDVMQGLEDLFMPGGGASDAEILASQEYKDLVAGGASRKQALDALRKDYQTSFIRQYGPGAAAGVTALALSGGFKRPDEPKTKEQQEFEDRMRESTSDVIARDPSRYYLQGVPGVRYDEQGNVIGSKPMEPTYTVADVTGREYSPYSPVTASTYLPSAFMSPYGERYLNQGGIASLAQGGYPRRIGQIDGPGTETSDSIPAMLSDGEFVMTARAVRGMGNGSRREGARRMYALMHTLENNAARG